MQTSYISRIILVKTAMKPKTSVGPKDCRSMNAVLLQADEVLVKPFDGKQLAALMDKGRLTSLPSPRPVKEGAAPFWIATPPS